VPPPYTKPVASEIGDVVEISLLEQTFRSQETHTVADIPDAGPTTLHLYHDCAWVSITSPGLYCPIAKWWRDSLEAMVVTA
jgi:hypothetical protein